MLSTNSVKPTRSRLFEITFYKTLSAFSASACLTMGCGAPAEPPMAPTASSTTASVSAETNKPNEKVETKTPGSPTPTNNAFEDKPVQAEVTSFDEKTEEAKPAPQISPVTPATNKKTIGLINLLELPRFGEGEAMQSSSTYLYYSTKGTLPAADDFYKNKLTTLGWKEIPGSTPATEHYIDRLYSKDGFYLRASLSLGGQPDELGVMLASLGNVDLRNLPKLSDAESTYPATPVNVTYQTEKSIPEAADEVQKMLVEQGWQPWKEFQDNPVSVPHYRDFHYRKEACRLLIGIVKNPQNPADKTSVSYISEFVTPFDIPMLQDGQTLKMDLYSNRAAFDASSARADLVKLLQSHGEGYGWTVSNTDKFESGVEHMLQIHTKSGAYLVARLVESGGKYSTTIEAFATAPDTKSPSTETIAETDSPVMNSENPTKSDSTFQNIEAEVNSAIQAEVAKAIGSLGVSTEKAPMNLADLEAKAKELQSMFATEGQDNDSNEDDTSKANPFDVAEDTDAPSVEYQSIKEAVCKVTFGDKVIELKHAACYVMYEYGEATKCILFSDQPIDQSKLKRQLLKTGESVYGIDVSPNSSNMFDFRVKKDSVSLNAKLDAYSLGMSTSKINSNVTYHQGKLVGKMETVETLSVGENELTFIAQLNQPTIQIDWASRESTTASALVADESKEHLVPEGCTSYSSEGSQYSKRIEAVVKAPITSVQSFYKEEFTQRGWKLIDSPNSAFGKFQLEEKECELKLESNAGNTVITLHVRDIGAAKTDGMLPPPGKAMLVLGNMSELVVKMTIGGKEYIAPPSDNRDPKGATKVVVDPGMIKVRVSDEKGGKTYDLEADVTANTTWGVLFDTSFQDVLQLL